MDESYRERYLRIGAAMADRGIFVPGWLLAEAISSTAMADDGEGTFSAESGEERK